MPHQYSHPGSSLRAAPEMIGTDPEPPDCSPGFGGVRTATLLAAGSHSDSPLRQYSVAIAMTGVLRAMACSGPGVLVALDCASDCTSSMCLGRHLSGVSPLVLSVAPSTQGPLHVPGYQSPEEPGGASSSRIEVARRKRSKFLLPRSFVDVVVADMVADCGSFEVFRCLCV